MGGSADGTGAGGGPGAAGGAAEGDAAGASAGASAGVPVGASIGVTVGASVGVPAGAPVGATASVDRRVGSTIDRTGQLLGERFRLERLLRVGSIATLYAATDVETARPVVARVLDAAPPFGERFTQRALILCSLQAPRVARLYAAVRTDDGVPVLVEEPFEGESLPERMSRRALTLVETLEVLDQLLDALAAVHPRGQVHGDLRPENLYLGLDPLGDLSVQVRGVGYARLFGEQAAPTLGGLLYGNPLFTAPEQWVNRPVDAATDVYAVGALAYLMLTGETFIRPGAPFAVCRQHFNAARPRVRRTVLGEAVPPALAEAVARAAAPDRAQRYADAAALQAALRVAMSQAGEAQGEVLEVLSADEVGLDEPSGISLGMGVEVEDESFNLDASILEDIAFEVGREVGLEGVQPGGGLGGGLGRGLGPDRPAAGAIDLDATSSHLEFAEMGSFSVDLSLGESGAGSGEVEEPMLASGPTAEAELAAVVAEMAADEGGSLAGSMVAHWSSEASALRAAGRSLAVAMPFDVDDEEAGPTAPQPDLPAWPGSSASAPPLAARPAGTTSRPPLASVAPPPPPPLASVPPSPRAPLSSLPPSARPLLPSTAPAVRPPVTSTAPGPRPPVTMRGTPLGGPAAPTPRPAVRRVPPTLPTPAPGVTAAGAPTPTPLRRPVDPLATAEAPLSESDDDGEIPDDTLNEIPSGDGR